ncbi:hypothetical protein PHYSODRAFT_258259 [Phytophthora sojae]|uniref:START domain-containing protein n=1 Tax=Phytophthora sojae (strain P6497) TaxID=1094619 RepID=G5ABW5_PHYSP|nr:hypothetical protein PHYSODRAFT_258259 [Phytophthora sojae]EGZ06840.1 hypothetical protein PHYSODRAFT_258259 [Phytophthora sojae]|eukprot:XP_009537604.1 hypothetical protein PHYSODRAFT_258259 [Phytophthora sojae]
MDQDRFTVNPFPGLQIPANDQAQLQELASSLLQSKIDDYNAYVLAQRRIKEREGLVAYAERPESSPAGTGSLSGSGLPMVLCVGTMKGNLNDLMYGVVGKDLKAMRLIASYTNNLSAGAVLDPIIQPTIQDRYHTLTIKWMELDFPLASTNLVKNRDYVCLEGTGFVTAQNGDRLGYHLLHSVSFEQTPELPNRVRGNVSIIGMWHQAGPNTIEMYGTGIFDPCGDMIRMLVVPGIASGFMSSVNYVHCGQMRKLSFMLEKAYAESKLLGTPSKDNECVTCSASGRRKRDFARSNSTCKLCFGHVVQKLSFENHDLQLQKRKVTFCTKCIGSVVSMNAMDCARAKVLGVQKGGARSSIGTDGSMRSGEFPTDLSYVSSS